MMRFQLPSRPESLNHIPIPYVNNLSEKLIDGKLKGYPGTDSVQMQSNDYLSLSGNKHIIDAEVRALQRLGHGSSTSRIFTQHFTRVMQFCGNGLSLPSR
jgi:7-keto-8-aminopelargonate synthetase-like enzyme